jgi:hypothetical protein
MYRRYSFSSIIMIILILACTCSGASQNYDYIWFYGWNNNPANPDLHGGRVDFNTNPPQAMPDLRPIDLGLYGHTMSDALGEEVLYYSNGLHIYNAAGEIMEGGDSINQGYFWDVYYPNPYGVPFSGLSIPHPVQENIYLYFHQPVDRIVINEGLSVAPSGVYCAYIDMLANDGLGKVDSVVLISTAFNAGFGLTKTADNAGWWMVFGKHQSNIYYTYLIDGNGINLHAIDTLGINIYENTDWIDQPGYSLFSPDGTQFARSDFWNGITILDFDRCEGKLSNARFYDTEYVNAFTFLAFSPNSRFLYYNTNRQLIQLDTKLEPDGFPLDTIANWDRYYELNNVPFSDAFAFSELAPDGKIYFSATGSSRHYHVIERPNLPGAACGFRQHGFPLPTSNGATIPHFPNYRLEPIECD